MLTEQMIMEALLTSIKEAFQTILEGGLADLEQIEISTLVDDEGSPIGVKANYGWVDLTVKIDLECYELWSIGHMPNYFPKGF